MSLSAIALKASKVLQRIADAVHNTVVLKSIRMSYALKAKGLDLAMQDADKLYWYAVDEAVVAKNYLSDAEKRIKEADAKLLAATRAVRTFEKKGL